MQVQLYPVYKHTFSAVEFPSFLYPYVKAELDLTEGRQS